LFLAEIDQATKLMIESEKYTGKEKDEVLLLWSYCKVGVIKYPILLFLV
jgi:hypothetical protein